MNIFSQVQTGDIFVLRWGYGQTNVGFFQVMRAAAQTVVIRRLNSHFTKKPKSKSNEGWLQPGRAILTPAPAWTSLAPASRFGRS